MKFPRGATLKKYTYIQAALSKQLATTYSIDKKNLLREILVYYSITTNWVAHFSHCARLVSSVITACETVYV